MSIKSEAVDRVIASIQALSLDDFLALNEWFKDHLQDRWDAQIERDEASGKLDFMKAWTKDDDPGVR